MKSKKILAFIFSLVIVGAAYLSPHMKKYVAAEVVSADEYVVSEVQSDEEKLQDKKTYHGVLWIADFDEKDEVDAEGYHNVTYAFDEAEEDGEIFSVTLKVNQNAEPGDYEIGFGKEGSVPCFCSTYEEYDTDYVSGHVSVGKDAYERPQRATDFRTTVSFEDVVCDAGDTITVKAVITENQGISAFNLFMNYDSDVFSVVGIRPCGEFAQKGEFNCSGNVNIISEAEENEAISVISSDDTADSEDVVGNGTAETELYDENEENIDVPDAPEKEDVPTDIVPDKDDVGSDLSDEKTEEIVFPNEDAADTETESSEEGNPDVNGDVLTGDDNNGSEGNNEYGWELVDPETGKENEKTDEEVIADMIENGEYSSFPEYSKNAVLWLADYDMTQNGVEFNTVEEDGRVFSVTFKVNENAKEGNYEISFAEDENPQSFCTQDGDMDIVYRSGIISIEGIAPVEEERLAQGDKTVVYFTNESASRGQYVTIYAEIKNNAGTAAFNSFIKYDSSVFSLESIDACGAYAESGDFMTN